MPAWPGKSADDVTMVYVAIPGDGESEAVLPTLGKIGTDFLIRALEVGRP